MYIYIYIHTYTYVYARVYISATPLLPSLSRGAWASGGQATL